MKGYDIRIKGIGGRAIPLYASPMARYLNTMSQTQNVIQMDCTCPEGGTKKSVKHWRLKSRQYLT